MWFMEKKGHYIKNRYSRYRLWSLTMCKIERLLCHKVKISSWQTNVRKNDYIKKKQLLW